MSLAKTGYAYKRGLLDVGRGTFAWMQPDGSWGWSNAGLITDGDQSLLVDTLFDLKLTREFRWGRLAATINDLLDEQYYTYAVRSNFVPDRYNVYPLPGRTLSVIAEIKVD